MFVWLFAIGLIALLVLVTAIVLIRNNNKKNKISGKEYAGYGRDMTEPSNKEPSGGIRGFTLTRIKDGVSFSHPLVQKITMGRGDGCGITLADDALSEVHCTFMYDGYDMVVNDTSSKNGTFVNGIPVVGQMPLKPNDILLIGSYEYKVAW